MYGPWVNSEKSTVYAKKYFCEHYTVLKLKLKHYKFI